MNPGDNNFPNIVVHFDLHGLSHSVTPLIFLLLYGPQSLQLQMPSSADYGDSLHRVPSNLPRWRPYAKDFSRRPLLVKQVTYLAIVLAFTLPLWYFHHIRSDNSTSQIITEQPPEDFSLDVHNVIPHYGHNSPGHHANKPVVPAPSLVEDDIQTSPIPSSVTNLASSDPVTFAFVMWEPSSAVEGALLIKVRHCF